MEEQMKTNFNLWLMEILTIAIDCYVLYLLFPMLMMLLQYILAIFLGGNYFLAFYCLMAAFLFFAIILVVSLFRFKKWSFNIFIGVTLLINILLWFFLKLSLLKALLIIIFLCSIIYFLKPSTRKLFIK